MVILLKRAFEKPSPKDGTRILVERLWPRGLGKEESNIDRWPKEIAPSNELRKWYSHDPNKWSEFKRRYWIELETKKDTIKQLSIEAKKGDITFFGSK